MSHVIWRDHVWFDPRPPASDAAISLIEAEVGARLPPSYVEYLRHANGGNADYAVRLSSGSAYEDEAVFSDWYRAGEPGDEGPGTIVGDYRSLNAAWFREQLPQRFLPIARTGGEDDTLLLDLTDERHGTILAWMSALPQMWGRRPQNVLHEVAPDFDALIEKLFISDELMHLAWPPASPPTAEGRRDLEAWLDHSRPGWRHEVNPGTG